MERKQKIYFGAMVLHLTLVILGAMQCPLSQLGSWVKPLIVYGGLTGADSGYGFFAPGVGTHLRAEFELENGKDDSIVASLSPEKQREYSLRVSNILSSLFEGVSDKEMRTALTSSWAGKVLFDHPGFQTVTVKLESYELPPMEKFRVGVRGKWVPFYSVKYSLNKE